jgi:hypothetical protein
MAAGKKSDEHQASDSTLKAVQTVYHALRALPADECGRVISSVIALLNVPHTSPTQGATGGSTVALVADQSTSAKKLSLVELVKDKEPKTNPERIALFAYYREHIEGQPHFERDDLRPYFVKARIAQPTNYDRDFVSAVSQGWIHEDGSDSYLTNSGTQAVESGFAPAARAGGKSSKGAARKKKRSARKGAHGRGKHS